jgi:type IX secretion system PorP/SprF family membrane protein
MLLALVYGMHAQDIQYSQSYSNPLFLNPAFAGTAETTRFIMNSRLQWPGIGNPYRSYGVGADTYLWKMNSGLGVSFVRDVAGTHRMSNSVVNLAYSQHIRTGYRSTLTMGVQVGFGQRSFQTDRLLFADQVINESAVSLDAPQLAPNVTYSDLSIGGLFFMRQFWLGAAMFHINQPNQSFMSGVEGLSRRFTLHGGWNVPSAQFKNSRNNKELKLLFNYKAQREWDQLDLGGYYSAMGVHFGLWYRGLPFKAYAPGYTNQESLVFLIGYETEKGHTFGYSYDYTLSRLAGFSAGAHEVSMKVQLKSKKRKPKRRIVPCAKF